MYSDKKINILMITGVYLPEINGAVLQCHQLINKLKNFFNFSILTSTNNKSLNKYSYIGDIPVNRIHIIKDNKIEYILGTIKYFTFLIKLFIETDLIHIHGFSKKNSIVILFGVLFRKKIILKMTSFGHDDSLSIKNKSIISWFLFRLCDLYIGISPAFLISYNKSGLPINKYIHIPNGVDTLKYSPISQIEKLALKFKLGYAEQDKIILFIGHFSPDKRPDFLYKAWINLCERDLYSKILFIGITENHYEVDEKIIYSIREDSIIRGLNSHIKFIEKTSIIDEYLKIANVFVLPSLREGLPNVLLEAMASAVPCVVNNLPGVTDWLIDDMVTGILFSTDDPKVLADKISPFLLDNEVNNIMGLAARSHVEKRFSLDLSCKILSEQYMNLMN